MKLVERLRSRQPELSGQPISERERDVLIDQCLIVGNSVLHLFDLMMRFSVSGTIFVLDESQDLSGLGVEMKWMTVEQMIDEMKNCYPSRLAVDLNYLPIGVCLGGSGDPYYLFINGNCDPPLVRIPHESVCATRNTIDVARIELVSKHLSRFVEFAQIE